MNKTQLVFVGHHPERLIESIRKYHDSFQKIILIRGEDKTIEGEDITWRKCDEMETVLKQIWPVEIRELNKIDVMKATFQLMSIINEERRMGNEVIVNASGSMRTLAMAGYIASSLLGTALFTALPRYDEHGNDIGVDIIIDVPTLPVSFPGDEQMKIIVAIGNKELMNDQIILEMIPDLERDSPKFKNERSRISHHLSRLEDMGFIIRKKQGRNSIVRLSDLGKAIKKSIP